MNSDKKTSLITRDALLKLLSDDEVASVSSAETAGQLADGDEYLDLANLDKGVLGKKQKHALWSRAAEEGGTRKDVGQDSGAAESAARGRHTH